jgi:carboxymethylenebutenolidase
MASFWEIQRVESAGDLLDDMNTYVSQPNIPGRVPAIIVIQEVFGVNSHIQAITDRFAAEGFFAVAPALFHRVGTTEAARGTNPIYSYAGIAGVPDDPPQQDARTKAVQAWNDDEIILDINTTIDWLKRHPRTTGERIGIVGFCAGGRITYLAAAACPGLSAAVDFYGGNKLVALGGVALTPFDRTASIQCPVMGNFGDQDQNPTVDHVRQLEAELKKHGKTADFKIYPGAGHGFMCDERTTYHEASAKDAWTRTVGWFQKHLVPVAAKA